MAAILSWILVGLLIGIAIRIGEWIHTRYINHQSLKLAKSRARHEPKSVILTCQLRNDQQRAYNVSESISVEVKELSSYGFGTSCSYSVDVRGKKRSAPHMCTASSADFFCDFRMRNIIISRRGLLYTYEKRRIKFHHPSVNGLEPRYWPKGHDIWVRDTPRDESDINRIRISEPEQLRKKRFDLVVPIRMKWDDCFNHLSFQTLPLLGYVYEFHPDLFRRVHWHCSLYSAALLALLDVPLDRLVVEKEIFAEQALLPWIPSWNPLLLASIRVVAHRVSSVITSRLLSMHFNASDWMEFKANNKVTDIVSNDTIGGVPLGETRLRYIVYLQREPQEKRSVTNEKEIFEAIRLYLRPEYKLVILGHTREFKNMKYTLMSWQRYARIISRARVLIGPHGGGWNNMIWMPNDCDVIEFNEYPDDRDYTRSHGRIPVRRVFLNAFWSKGGTGQHYTIPPSIKDATDFYSNKMRISVKDVLQVLYSVDSNRFLNITQKTLQTYPTELHGLYAKKNPCYHCLPNT